MSRNWKVKSGSEIIDSFNFTLIKFCKFNGYDYHSEIQYFVIV